MRACRSATRGPRQGGRLSRALQSRCLACRSPFGEPRFTTICCFDFDESGLFPAHAGHDHDRADHKTAPESRRAPVRVRPRLRCGGRRPRSRMGARVRLQCAPGADRRDPGGIGRPQGGGRRPAPARRNRAHGRLRRAARLQPAPVPLLRLAPAAPVRADRAAHLHHARKSRAPAGRRSIAPAVPARR